MSEDRRTMAFTRRPALARPWPGGVDLEVEFLPSGHLAVSFEDATAGVECDKELGSDLTVLAACIRALHPRA